MGLVSLYEYSFRLHRCSYRCCKPLTYLYHYTNILRCLQSCYGANSKYKILMFTIKLKASEEQMRSICDYRKR